MGMISFYRDMYHQEMQAVFADGVEYDFNEDGTIQNSEKDSYLTGRLNR
jgi:hypothetical protein